MGARYNNHFCCISHVYTGHDPFVVLEPVGVYEDVLKSHDFSHPSVVIGLPEFKIC